MPPRKAPLSPSFALISESTPYLSPETMKQTIILPCYAILAFFLVFNAVRAKAENSAASEEAVVYFTSDISAEGLVRVYEKLVWQPQGDVAIKISTGEPPASNYLHPELLGDLVKKLNGTIVECNTAYGGSRSESAMHRRWLKTTGIPRLPNLTFSTRKAKC